MLKVAHIHMINAQLPQHRPVMTDQKKLTGNQQNTFQNILAQALDKKSIK